jgi:arylsulfatase A-like enzyme
MNFQTVSTAEKLPTSNGLPGGYLADGVTPGPLLTRALDYINKQVGAMRGAIDERELGDKTVMILSAKHGQSPQTPSALTRIPDGPIIDALNAAWKAAHPTAVQPLAVFSINDDGMLLWLNEHTQAAADFAREFLLHHSGVGNDINGNPKPYTSSGLATIYAGAAAAAYFKVPYSDARVPDIFGVSQYGTVFTGGKKKIAEHGGANIQDLHVPLVVSGGLLEDHSVRSGQVETTQIAPTILKLLGLDPSALKAVRLEHTATLPLSAGDTGPSE